ncbi:MAG: hypothetical protein IPK52_13510 [Chloroflexi bacterium]|nr:hypothetical protein [Chloroflexota bacterium]
MAEFAQRLLSNRMAVLGIIIIILFVLIALFADFVAPYSATRPR